MNEHMILETSNANREGFLHTPSGVLPTMLHVAQHSRGLGKANKSIPIQNFELEQLPEYHFGVLLMHFRVKLALSTFSTALPLHHLASILSP